MDTNSISHHDDNTGNRITKGKQPKRSAAGCEAISGINNQPKRKMNKECKGKMLRSIENILPSTSTYGTSYSYGTGSLNIPSTSTNDPAWSYGTGTKNIPSTSTNDPSYSYGSGSENIQSTSTNDPSCSYSTGTEDIPSTSTNDTSCSYSTGSENIEPEKEAFYRVRNSKSKKLQGLPLEKAEFIRVRLNQQERERKREINGAYDQLRKLDIPYNEKLAAEHKVETKIYTLKSATQHIRDLMAILENSDRYLASSNVGKEPAVKQIHASSNDVMEPDGNPILASFNVGIGPVGSQYPKASFVSVSVGKQPPRSAIVGTGYVGKKFLRSPNIRSVNQHQRTPLLNCPVQNITNLHHPSQYSGQSPHNFSASSSNQQYTHVDITPKAGKQVSGIKPDSRPVFPHFSPINQAQPSPMTSWQGLPISAHASTSQSYTSMSQPYTSTPVSGYQFWHWHQSQNHHSDFISRPNYHNQVNVITNQSHGQLTYSGNLQNTSTSNNRHINDSGFLELSNTDKSRNFSQYTGSVHQTGKYRYSQDSTHSGNSTDSGTVFSSDFNQASSSSATNLGYTSNLSVNVADQHNNWGSNVINNVWSGQYNNAMSGQYDNNWSSQYGGGQSGY